MKKLLILLIVTTGCFSCKKDNAKVCWYCTFGYSSGSQPPPKTVCNDGEEPSGFKDEYGNDLAWHCEKK